MMPYFFHDYETPTRSCYAVIDDFGQLAPTNTAACWFLWPEVNIAWSATT